MKRLVIIITQLSDCVTCREIAYEAGSRINKQSGDHGVVVFGTALDKSFEVSKSGLNIPFYVDDVAHVKKQVNPYHTPIMVILDSGKVIKHILSIFPYSDSTLYDQDKKITEFMYNAIFD